ncbi:MAG TPA: flavin reductase family protein [Acidimicrobiales bacterium]|jgi:flavin reductase (DIM6/NTAB) family NADH-FMN oxidoreductase RutF
MTMADAFADLMLSVDTAMSIVTTAAAGERAGCLIGFQAQCSIEPVRYVVWLSKANHTLRVGLRAPRFAVHFLTEDDVDLAELFGTVSGDDVDKFTRCSWTEGPDGLPLLDRCPNRIVARRGALLDEGSDHVCVVVEPESVDCAGPFAPLRFSRVRHLDAGHDAEERPHPPTERSA